MDRPFSRDHPELGQVAPERVDRLGALANQQVPRAEHDGCGLLVRALEGDEPHGGALGGVADASASAMSFFCRLSGGVAADRTVLPVCGRSAPIMRLQRLPIILSIIAERRPERREAALVAYQTLQK